METSIFLAKVLGLVSAISALAVMVRYKESLTMEEEAAERPSSVYASGFLILIGGVLLVVSHSVWVWDWRLVITILSWMVLLKGLGRIFFPNSVKSMIAKKKTHRAFILGEAVVFLVGLYLLYYSFIVYY
ncbi:MAG: hypothetical protein A2945_03490 [Candidatus Liptonbacteria bacterium RIFCSPLOWO2_01_FULL_52_25]|uniref:Uncharacterized protein n=1 Tax=Candidatus Liptonbacteria bacterium RIFCSPLOWO2_01_FULL_52_25 TaxID=1798650 RepID=A0A1G2CG54_9BACT|nr:MAG: hypothetical protein A2945_03490 [Candidatus Liptonbacteria bacterium RIFCSPLOWO2_01_FULL_52_25]